MHEFCEEKSRRDHFWGLYVLTQATSTKYSYVKHIYRLTLDLGISMGFEGVIVSFAKFSNANGACPTCVELSDAGVWELLLNANLEFPDDESPDSFLLEVGNGSFAICGKFFTAEVWRAELIANLEFPDNESPDFFLSVMSEDVFRA